jgi:hypothetical protein
VQAVGLHIRPRSAIETTWPRPTTM